VRLSVDLRTRVGDFGLDVRFRAAPGITALFGPSGAGKTLVLRHVAGLERPREGRVTLGGRTLTDTAAGVHLPPRARRVGLVFQEHALFPHMSVASNVAYGIRGRPAEERRRRVEELLALVELEGYADRRPGSLSGGERQRVALARALAPEPELLLLDEPFAALDFRVRRELRAVLRGLAGRTGTPMVLVTHALADVRALADDLVLIDRGRIVASGEARALLAAPEPAAAATLLAADDLA